MSFLMCFGNCLNECFSSRIYVTTLNPNTHGLRHTYYPVISLPVKCRAALLCHDVPVMCSDIVTEGR